MSTANPHNATVLKARSLLSLELCLHFGQEMIPGWLGRSHCPPVIGVYLHSLKVRLSSMLSPEWPVLCTPTQLLPQPGQTCLPTLRPQECSLGHRARGQVLALCSWPWDLSFGPKSSTYGTILSKVEVIREVTAIWPYISCHKIITDHQMWMGAPPWTGVLNHVQSEPTHPARSAHSLITSETIPNY